jgi:putative tryptophan/tyrosine transport system substrate-binding protein
LFITHFETLAAISLRRRLVAISGYRTFAEAGCLLAYGPNYFDLYKRAASYVGKILKGEKPADLPVEQPTRLEFVVNLKTAKLLGVNVPTSTLLRADELIE